MVYYVIACYQEGASEADVQAIVENKVLRDGNRKLGEVFAPHVDKSQFKVGSLDQLMEMMEIFSKYDLALDSSCKRNERMYTEMCAELNKNANLVIEVSSGRRGGSQQMSVEDYIKNFKWDQVRFQMDKSLKVLGAKIQGTQKGCDERLKKLLDEQNQIKT